MLKSRSTIVAGAFILVLSVACHPLKREIVHRDLNTPDEGMTPRPVLCRLVDGKPIDSAATNRLLHILHDRGSAASRASRVALELPGVSTFESLEAHACPIVDAEWNESTTYIAFVDTLIPLLINSTDMHWPDNATPHLVSAADESQFSHYPRKVSATWHSVSRADHYVLEVQEYMGITPQDRSGAMAWAPHNDGLHNAQVRDTSATFYFIGEGRGRWRVRTIGRRGESSDPSAWRVFVFTK